MRSTGFFSGMLSQSASRLCRLANEYFLSDEKRISQIGPFLAEFRSKTCYASNPPNTTYHPALNVNRNFLSVSDLFRPQLLNERTDKATKQLG